MLEKILILMLLTLVFFKGRQRLGSKARPMSCRFLAVDFLLSHAFLICGLKKNCMLNTLNKNIDITTSKTMKLQL